MQEPQSQNFARMGAEPRVAFQDSKRQALTRKYIP